jgi:hypothetical protein
MALSKKGKGLLAGGLTAAFIAAAAGGYVLLGHENSSTPGQPETRTQGPIKADSHDPQKFLELEDLIINTKDGRTLSLNATAYCESVEDNSMDIYEQKCRAIIQNKLDIVARISSYFEASIPAASSDVRNHKDLPQNEFSERYSKFTKEMIGRAIDLTKFDDDLYTVTKIRDITPKP